MSCYVASLQVGPARGKPFSADFLMAVLDWASRQQREQQRAVKTLDLPPPGTGVQQPAAEPIQVMNTCHLLTGGTCMCFTLL